jgi:poly(glycerol-phosphate) alpha-glucosyltransferase
MADETVEVAIRRQRTTHKGQATTDDGRQASASSAPFSVAFLLASVSREAGGLFTSVRRLAQSLHLEQDTRVTVLGVKDEHSAADLAEWTPLTPRLFWSPGVWALDWAPGMGRAVRDLDVKLVHTQSVWLYPAAAALKWSRLHRRPYLATTRGMLTPASLSSARWKKRVSSLLFAQAHLRGAACLHVLTDAEAAAVRGHGLRNPICVIPNGVDVPAHETTAQPAWAKRIPLDRKVLLFLGRLHRVKGLAELLRAWQELRRRGSRRVGEWELVLAGWGHAGHDEELKALAREAGLADCVHFCGPQLGAAKLASFGRADGFVLPSRGEGLPMAALEAWAAGVPAVLTAESGLPEGFAERAALRIRPEAEDIARVLDEFFAMTDAQRKEMGARGRALVERRFTWSRIAAEMRAVYGWVLGGGTPPDCVRWATQAGRAR